MMTLNMGAIGVLAVLLITYTCLAANCYTPNGLLMSSDYQPCKLDSGHSMCCASNRTTKNVNHCVQHYLCADGDSNILWRESCTDPTWQDDACLKLCTDGIGMPLCRAYMGNKR
jgi:hypothetical protein